MLNVKWSSRISLLCWKQITAEEGKLWKWQSFSHSPDSQFPQPWATYVMHLRPTPSTSVASSWQCNDRLVRVITVLLILLLNATQQTHRTVACICCAPIVLCPPLVHSVDCLIISFIQYFFVIVQVSLNVRNANSSSFFNVSFPTFLVWSYSALSSSSVLTS